VSLSTLHRRPRQLTFIVDTINKTKVTYDAVKSERNEAERGLAFSLAKEFDWSTALIAEDVHKDYEERRYQALGMLGERLHMLVFTPREGAVHVISLRRTKQRERMRCATQVQA